MSETVSVSTPEALHRRLQGTHVLIVDDDKDFLQLVAAALGHLGIAVECARTPGEAVARAMLHPPDLILLDILLPGSDGLEILEILRGEPETKGVPVIAFTALGERDSGPMLLDAGFDGLISKPIDWSRLASELERALA